MGSLEAKPGLKHLRTAFCKRQDLKKASANANGAANERRTVSQREALSSPAVCLRSRRCTTAQFQLSISNARIGKLTDGLREVHALQGSLLTFLRRIHRHHRTLRFGQVNADESDRCLDTPAAVNTGSRQNVSEMDDDELARIRNQEVGFVFQPLPVGARHCASHVELPLIYGGIDRKGHEMPKRHSKLSICLTASPIVPMNSPEDNVSASPSHEHWLTIPRFFSLTNQLARSTRTRAWRSWIFLNGCTAKVTR